MVEGDAGCYGLEFVRCEPLEGLWSGDCGMLVMVLKVVFRMLVRMRCKVWEGI